MNDEDVKEIKTILVGMSGTGKTNIINVLTGHGFDTSKCSTTTCSFVDKYMEVKQKKYRLEIWDTAGQEQFRSLTNIFIKDSKIVIFVYDITNKESFEEVDFWVNSVKEMLGDNPVFGLAGNKKDLFTKEEVEEEEGEKKANEINAIFKLTSAKTGHGINDFMQILLEEYVKRIESKGKSKDSKENRDDERRGQRLDSSYEIQIPKKRKCC